MFKEKPRPQHYISMPKRGKYVIMWEIPEPDPNRAPVRVMFDWSTKEGETRWMTPSMSPRLAGGVPDLMWLLRKFWQAFPDTDLVMSQIATLGYSSDMDKYPNGTNQPER